MRKWIILLVLLVIAIISYNYIYQDHRNIQNEDAEFVLLSKDLAYEFDINPSEAEAKYLNKTLQVTGKISQFDTNEVTLDRKIFCLLNSDKKLNPLETVTIKGRFIGYDHLLDELKLDQCIIIN